MSQRLVKTDLGDGAAEWRVESPFVGWRDIAPAVFISGALGLVLYKGGWPLEQAAVLGLLAVFAALTLQSLLEVSAESVTLVPGQGVVLKARRRVGPKPKARALRLQRLQGLELEEAEVGGKRRTVLAFALKPPAAVAQEQEGQEEEDRYLEAELLFPNMQPPLPLLRQVHAELAPLLAAELAGGGAAAKEAREPKKEK